MENYPLFLHRKLDNFTLDEYIIMFVVCSIFRSLNSHCWRLPVCFSTCVQQEG